MGERLTSVTGYTEYIRRHATDALRCSAEQLGGISAAMKVASLAECFGMNCEPHSSGHVLYQAASLQAMLSLDNCNFFELPFSEGIQNTGNERNYSNKQRGVCNRSYKTRSRIDLDEEKIANLTV